MYNEEPRYCDLCGEFHGTQTVNVGRYEYAFVCDECAREVDVYEAQFEQGWNDYDEASWAINDLLPSDNDAYDEAGWIIEELKR